MVGSVFLLLESRIDDKSALLSEMAWCRTARTFVHNENNENFWFSVGPSSGLEFR